MRKTLAICCVCLLIVRAHAQDLGSKSFNLTVNNHPVKINCIFKNSQGYIYAGTTDGLYSFDGISFKKINFSKPNVRDTVTSIFEDNSKQLWLGFKNGHLAKKINSKLEYFEPEEGYPTVAITAFVQDKQNNIWFATNGEGIYYFNNKHLYLVDSANGLSDLHIHALAQTPNGDMLAATDAGLNICRMVNGKIHANVIGPNEGLPDYYATAITAAGDNKFWIGLQDKGYCLYDHNTGKIIFALAGPEWKYGQINSLLVAQKALWIGTEENGLIVKPAIDKPASSFTNVSNTVKKITGLLQDNEGNIWFNTSTELKATPGNQLQLLPLYNQTGFDNIRAMLCDQEGNFWVNNSGRLIKYMPANGSFAKREYHFAELNSRTDISCLYEDINHHIWLGTMGAGILVLDPETGKYRQLT
ncbi:MAG TPA: two-component regulator propeller domain-containing protein, partial [Ferruginibacter sp.]|nr:two-component regulator propeller domain-containing protein [Ferruginibacter sp.]